MSLTFATQLTAVATTVLAAFAVITAVFALLAFRKQSREVDILLKQNQREADESRRAQAAHVFTTVPHSPGPEVRVHARNASHAPVYDAQLFYAREDELTTGPDDLGVIMPGEEARGSLDISAGGSPGISPSGAFKKTWLAFRDAAGIYWMRTPDGVLWEIEHRLLRGWRADSHGLGWHYGPTAAPPMPEPEHNLPAQDNQPDQPQEDTPAG
jgi:hypothetical protein